VALLALGAVSVVLVVVVSHSLDSKTTTTTATRSAQSAPNKPKPPPDNCYTVQTGDTFSAIARSERVPQRVLQARNGGSSFDPRPFSRGSPLKRRSQRLK